MSFLTSILGTAARRPRASAQGGESGSDSILFISASDAGWRAELVENGIRRWSNQNTSAREPDGAVLSAQVAEAVEWFSAQAPQTNPGRVVLEIDDSDIQVVDHRFAKLHNFEPRGLKEFGIQQAGGRPVVFGSIPFGESSAREMQKRVLSFLPEDKLEPCFFSLGKLATSLVGVMPAGASALAVHAQEGIFAILRVHGYFSTLVIANAQSGVIAARQFPFGTLTLAKAYAEEQGVALIDAVSALRSRARLPDANAVKEGGAPENRTGTFLALAPVLRELHDEIATTLEYFRYQRLAGRPSQLRLTFTSGLIAGLDAWLTNALKMPTSVAENARSSIQEEMPYLNLLEGSRPGLLKLGNQPFEFTDGRFQPAKGAQPEMSQKKTAPRYSFQALSKINLRFRGRELTLTREEALRPVAVLGMVVLLALGNSYLVTGPADQRLDELTAVYASAAEASIALTQSSAQPNIAREQPVLWADNLFAIGQSLLPGMKLERLELTPPVAKTGTGSQAALTITGAFSSASPANLKSVADFIDALSKDKDFTRRFAQLRFTGAGKSTDTTRREMIFRVTAVSGGAAR